MSFQSQVHIRYAPAQAGDFASANPRFNVLAGPGSLVAGALGVLIGVFAWAVPGPADIETGETDFYNTVNSFGAGLPTGFVHREQQGLITIFLAEAGNTIQAGSQMALMSGGDYWAKNTGAGATAVNQKVYASFADGTISTGATGAPPTNATIVASTATNSVLTVTANTGKPIVVGQPVAGAGIAVGTTIASLGTGTGGAGTYNLSAPTTATAAGVAVTAQTSIETKYVVMSAAEAGALFKMSSHPLG